MATNHDLISAINPMKESWTIKASVVRLWFVFDLNRQGLPFFMEMVLMDEKVNVMGICSAVGTEREYEKNGVVIKMNVIELELNGYFKT
ncbi:hypothetical protein E2542_SST13956 [Spatholobus suberectus]|nr:hypothetical protein E2542_SST13956 [Spatholobus suberectus]